MSPEFKYRAKEGPDQLVEGVLEAPDSSQAVTELMRKGLTPLTIVEQQSGPSSSGIDRLNLQPTHSAIRVKKSDIVFFTRQMSDLLEASVPIFRALQLTAQKTSNAEFRQVIHQMGENIRNGASFSAELAGNSNLFSTYYVGMVKAGEMAGRLEAVLGRLAVTLEKEQEVLGKVRSSLAYPLFVLTIGCLTVFVLLSFVIPRFMVMFEDFGQSLPLPTLILMGLSNVLARFWWLFLLAGAGISIVWHKWCATESGRRQLDAFVLGLPVVGPYIQAVETGRFARILGTLIESGVALVPALDIARETVSNTVLKEQLSVVSSAVLHGMSLGNALQQVSFFPEMVSGMVFVGEETGRFEKGLYKVADLFEREAEQMTRTGVSLLGPLVLTAVIIVVGCIVIAVILPVMQMNQLIR
ncbi:MAG: type II secretion system F family protein [Candidatus Omnitrophica bacterium]|nr:type II secretion system F family protein [Candidatus Omnitrophota bacterium]